MILVVERGTSEDALRGILERLEAQGLSSRVLRVGPRPLIHLTQGDTRRARALLRHARVLALIPTSGPRIRAEGRHFYPYHALRAAAAGLLLLGLLVFLAGFLPPGVSPAPALGEPLPPAAWPWYLAPLRAVLELVPREPAWLGPTSLLALAALVLALPAIDRSRGDDLRSRWGVLAVGLLLVVAWAALSIRSWGS